MPDRHRTQAAFMAAKDYGYGVRLCNHLIRRGLEPIKQQPGHAKQATPMRHCAMPAEE